VKPDGFAADLYRKPEVLQRLAATLTSGNPWADVVPPNVERVVLLGMGSSAYAGGVAAARMRARGLVASSELASSQLLPGWGAGTLVVATSASGGSVETLDALDRLPDGVSTVALTNTAGSASPGVATPSSISRPNPKSAGWPAAVTSTPWPSSWRSNATSQVRTRLP
jgi:fructoselysine-6-P-deglycase FrlB-like protein